MPWSRLAVWRSSSLGWLITALALAAGIPQFLCLPPWNDVTLHDLAARNILRGGVHYRDLFDTNLPGIDWTMAAIRSVFGWSFVTLRAFDLLIVASSVAILAKLAGQRAAWFAAAVAMWYPFTSEFNHCQRDAWMLLPAAAATWASARNRGTIAQGFLWGVAVWFKPHVLIPAAAVWFTDCRTNRWRDLGGVLLGGAIAGILGVAWLVQTGAWPHFLDVFTRWNPEYVQDGIWQTLPFKMKYTVTCFLPWGLVHLAAVPAAVCDVRRRSPLAALYLGWLVQAVLLQKPFDYVQVPVLLLGFAVLASRGWSVGFPFLIWFVVWGRPALEEWPRCFHECGSPELRDRLGRFTDTPWGTNWEQLRDVENYLRTVDPPLGDRELTCWHDTTHPLYLSLGLEPSTRYMHYGTVFPLRGKVDEIRNEVIRSPQRYVVSDLLRMTRDPMKAQAGEGVPAWLPPRERERFPWNQAVVFRSGRYVVHRVTRTPRADEIDITDWSEVSE
ncbi:MAG: hypothetical protein U0791_07525 [Gemmataceae bacterium]